MWPDKIRMSRGGEKLEEVIGRGEEQELPEFDAGAFELDGGASEFRVSELVGEDRLDEFVPQGQIIRHTMHELIASVRVANDSEFECSQVTTKFTLLRFFAS